MQEWKQVVASIGVVAFLGRSFLWIVMFGPLLQDPEFDEAKIWAEEVGLVDLDLIEQYPFGMVQRKDAIQWYIATAQTVGLVPVGGDDCEFGDIATLNTEQQQQVKLACEYNFFRGNSGKLAPESYLTKAGSLVALVRGFYPGVEFEETDPYREPYVNLAYQEGITQRQSGPYLSYLVTRYELLLQLYRVSKLKK